ncbi:MAG: thaumarchaeosortase, partial [Candidatus Nitrosomaritimum yanchengensis]
MQNRNLYVGIAIISSPILFALAAFPDSFSLSWNQGRGGFLFALAFIIAETVGLKILISTKRLMLVIPLAILTII